MSKSDSTVEQVRTFWDERARSAGSDVERIDSRPRAQRMRFEIVARSLRLAGASVLDVGCGVGDFYGWLRERGLACDYTGVDLSAEMVARARAKYPEGRFEVADLLAWPDEPRFDYSVAIAIHNVRVEGGRQLLEALTRKQLAVARVAAHLSLLTDRYEGFAPDIQPWRAEEIFAFACTLTPWVTLRHDYLPNDFSLSLYRKPFIETEPGLSL